MGEGNGAYRDLVGTSELRTTLGRTRSRWDVYIKMDLQKVGWRNTNWIDLSENGVMWRGLVNSVTNIRVQ